MSRQPFAHTRHISVPATRLWNVISTPGYLESCHPLVEKNLTEAWPGRDSRDTVVYYGGDILHRHFTDWYEGVGYNIDVCNPKVKKSYRVTWRIQEHAPAESSLTIAIAPTTDKYADKHTRGTARLLTWLQHHIGRRLMAIWYLSLVLKGIEHVATTGQTVRRNQFGPYPVFSPPNRFPWKRKPEETRP